MIKKELNKIFTELYNKLESFYKLLYKNHDAYFLLQKMIKHFFTLIFIGLNIDYLIKYEFSILGIFVFNFIYCVIISILAFISCVVLYWDKEKIVRKVTDEEWKDIQNEYAYHVTSKKNLEGIKRGDKIYLKTTKYKLANLNVFFKNSLYLFSSMPTEEDIKYQCLKDKKDIIIKIPIRNLDKNILRKRVNKNVFVYLDEYYGEGEIEYLVLNE